MLFLLATPEYNNIQSNTTKVRVHLRSGIAEVFEQHQDLMGKIDNNLIEIETNFEKRLEKSIFVLQYAVFIVSNQKTNSTPSAFENQGTGVYVYAKRAKEINSNISLDEVTKQYDQKISALELVKQDSDNPVNNSKTILLTEEVDFLKKVISVVKEMKS
jgi:hypothetical protein